MKNYFPLLVIIFAITSCKKYEKDSSYSTYTVEQRLCKGYWSCTKIINLNNMVETSIPKFSGLMAFYKNNQHEILSTTQSGVQNYQLSQFTLKSDKEILFFNNTEFEIKSLTWKTLIIKSPITNKEYYFEKWIDATSLDNFYSKIENLYFNFPTIE
jgi:hypothetical protein